MRRTLAVLALFALMVAPFDPEQAAADEAERQYQRAVQTQTAYPTGPAIGGTP